MAALQLVRNLNLLAKPEQLFALLTSRKVLGLPTMLGLLPALYNVRISVLGSACASQVQAIVCICHHALNSDSISAHTVAGGISGLSLFFFENTSLAMYTLWKLIEVSVLLQSFRRLSTWKSAGDLH